MSTKRVHNIMLRLTEAERARLDAARPPGEELAAFARRTLLGAVDSAPPSDLRRAAAFVVAALSPEITFDQALGLFDENVPTTSEEVPHGRGD